MIRIPLTGPHAEMAWYRILGHLKLIKGAKREDGGKWL